MLLYVAPDVSNISIPPVQLDNEENGSVLVETDCNVENLEKNEFGVPAATSSQSKLWNDENTMLLIDLVKQNQNELQTQVKKTAFQKIATIINVKSSKNYTGPKLIQSGTA